MRRIAFALSLLSVLATSNAQLVDDSSTDPASIDQIQTALNDAFAEQIAQIGSKFQYDGIITPNAKVAEVKWENQKLQITFNQYMGDRSWTRESVDELENLIIDSLADVITVNENTLDLRIAYDLTGNFLPKPIEDWTTDAEQIFQRHQAVENPVPPLQRPVVVQKDYAGPTRENGLENRNFVIAASHGWTWHKENRWQYQRARVFTIVEDLFPQSYINPFLIPMLENAGANVWSPRERSYQTAEVIVDNTPENSSQTFQTKGAWQSISGSGWKGGVPAALAQEDEPFTFGDTLRATIGDDSSAEYIPFIPRDGLYPVYISWRQSSRNSASVPITITHTGGETRVNVNQKVAGGTWVYLGEFFFEKGANSETGKVAITTKGALPNPANEDGEEPNTFISADAIRFGGGMGNVAIEDHVSHHPRYAEGARYFTQYAGAPAEMVTNRYNSEGRFGFDYNNDITSRGEWANYLMGRPNGPNDFPRKEGLGIPLDGMVSWHTDAGGKEFGQIGTLMLWQLLDDNESETFPDGRSRWLNRDLSVYLMDEMVRTARENYSSSWAMREHRERGFGEIRRPNTPSALIELISHHNPNDMKYGLDPRFKKDMARSVYKGLLKFVAASNGFDAVVQPLEPNWIEAKHLGDGVVEIGVEGQNDHLEPSATPNGFIVYESTDGRGFDNGTFFQGKSTKIDGVPENETTYFRVTAVNEGGESLPSPTVGVRWSNDAENKALIVDGFDRISGPAIIDNDKGLMGFDRNDDPGVGYHYNYGLVGDQYNFDFNSDWVNDLEDPGRGGSKSDKEDRLEMGNHFNHIIAHGEALAAANLSFDSMTRKAFADSDSYSSDNLTEYDVVDWIAGEQKAVPPMFGFAEDEEGYPDKMKTEFEIMTDEQIQSLEAYLSTDNANLILSGAFIASELIDGAASTALSRDFAAKLGVTSYIKDATSTNSLIPATGTELPFARFGNDLQSPINIEPTVYPVEKATGFQTTPGSPLLHYGDSETIAGYATDRVAIFGFPLETVLLEKYRMDLFDKSLDSLIK